MRELVEKRITKPDIVVDSNLRKIFKADEEAIGIKVYPFDIKGDAQSHIRWHWHKDVEFIYVEEGEIVFNVAEERFHMKPGQVLFINEGALHSADAIRGVDCKFHSISFDYAKMVKAQGDVFYDKYIKKVIEAKDAKYFIIEEGDTNYNQFLSVLKLINNIFLEKGPYYEFECGLAAGRLWLFLMRYIDKMQSNLKERPQQRVLDEVRVKSAIQYIEEHYGEPITLDEIAQSVHVSNSECCRCFKRSLDMTPFEYLMRFRVYRTTEMMIEHKTMSVAEIASQAGFHSSSYYNKLFKKYMSCTPTEFRKHPEAFHWNSDNFMIPMC